MIFIDNPSVTIVNEDPLLTIVDIIVNKFYFSKAIDFVLKTVANSFLKVQNDLKMIV